jgi:hypothetical protein
MHTHLTRRQAIARLAGAAGAAAFAPSAVAASPHRKQLLVLFLSGGASQLETWDPKPGTKHGGPFRAINTSLDGVRIGELLPRTAKIMHRLAVVRSVNSNLPDHEKGHYAIQAGRLAPGYPVLGSAVAKLLEQPGDVLPGYITLRRAGPKAYTDTGDAGFLGAKYEGVRVIDGLPPENLIVPAGINAAALQSRDAVRRAADERFVRGRAKDPINGYSTTFDQAQALMQRREIFDLKAESPKDIERYGRHDFGQNCMLARRLLEAGVPCVRVVHFDWDAHQDNFYWHQIRCAEFDRTFVTLLDDLEQRGMLEHTLVVVTGEMGRTPQINNLGGRDHWGRAWSVAMAGCGIKQGIVHGATNDLGTEVKDHEVGIGDLFHTYLTALGIDSSEDYNLNGQTNPIADPAAKPIKAVLA